jgi:hypothetical protein
MIMLMPLRVMATSAADMPDIIYPSPVIITEIQTGAAAAGDEYVELYNVSTEAVDITDWQVRYVNASSASKATSLLASIANDSGQPVILQPRTYFLLHTATVAASTGIANQSYSAKLSSSDKTVALYASNKQTCAYEVADTIGWGVSTDGEGEPAVLSTATNSDRLIERYRLSDGRYVDTNSNNSDVKVTNIVKDAARPAVSVGATPGSDNTALYPLGSLPAPRPGSMLEPINISGCEIPEEIPTDNGLEEPTELPPVVVEPTDESSQSSGQGGTTAPKATMPARNIGLKSPQLTELLPNPGKPQTDANDEFIELYNSNDRAFELTGFKLTNGKKTYVFPSGTLLQPKSFKAFFSADTKVTLSNTQGQIMLLDPYGNAISKSDPYGSAKENQAWALANGGWAWTTTPSPNAANIIKAPAAKAKKTSSSSKKTSSSDVKTSTALYSPKNTAATTESKPFDDIIRNPLHPGVLALVGAFAILYGAYEYRADLANKIHQFRVYRAARRENRRKS